MPEKEVLEMIEKRRREEPEFRKKYDAFLAGRSAEGKLSDSELDQVSGGFFGFANCPNCGGFQTLETYTFGIYNCCTECGYEEWGKGW